MKITGKNLKLVRNTIDLYATQSMQYTYFPLDEIKLYVVRQESDWVIMLPSEY